MSKVLHKMRDVIPKNSVYVGRPGKWGNPFIIGRDGARDEVIQKFKHYLQGSPHLLDSLPELRGKDLVCWCAPQRCHADVLLALANQALDKQ